MQNSTEKVREGVMRVQQAPGQAAAQQKSQYLQGVQRSADKWAQNVAAVSLPEWQQAMNDKGIDRIGQGASAAESKMQAVGTKLLPAVQNVVSSLPPRGSKAANRARMNAFFDGMSRLEGTLSSR